MTSPSPLLERPRKWLQHPRLPWRVAAIAVLLGLPSLWLGWHTDDHLHRAALVRLAGAPEVHRSPARLFDFIRSDADEYARTVDAGFRPWWSSPDLRLSFFRPFTGLTHWLDYQLWPETPALMHVQSLLWFGGMVVLAAYLYRRMIPTAWAAGLAALAFALDDAHGLPAVWIANRNAMISIFFGLAAILAHDWWRRGNRPATAALGPAFLLLSLLANEAGVAGGGYILAYAVFIDRAQWTNRLRSLTPYLLVGIGWWAAYRSMGYGAWGSNMYIDPVASPSRFAGAVVDRGPLLLWGQWAMLSDLWLLLSDRAERWMWLVVLTFLTVVAVALAPLVRRDRVARFWALGMLLAVVPLCATAPSDRLLGFVGIGGMGLLAQFIASIADRTEWSVAPTWRRRLNLVLCAFLLVIHFVFAPIGLLAAPKNVARFGEVLARAAASLPSDPAVARQWVLVVNVPTNFVAIYGPLLQLMRGNVAPSRMLVMGSGIHSVTVSAPDEYTIVVRQEGGWAAPHGSAPPGRDSSHPLFDIRYAFTLFDELFRDERPMRLGRRIELTGMVIEITELTQDGRAAEATFRFRDPLSDPGHRWLQWDNGVFIPFTPPAPGERITLPPVQVPF